MLLNRILVAQATQGNKTDPRLVVVPVLTAWYWTCELFKPVSLKAQYTHIVSHPIYLKQNFFPWI